jgi:hypothetical protein
MLKMETGSVRIPSAPPQKKPLKLKISGAFFMGGRDELGSLIGIS